MINQENYIQQINQIDVNDLPEALKDGHEFIMKVTAGGTQWDTLMPNAKAVVNLQFQKLDEYIQSSKSKVALKEKSTSKPSKQTAPKHEKKLAKVRKPQTKTVVSKTIKKSKSKKNPIKKSKAKPIVKPAITVKKYSLELQHIKRFAHLDGKDHKVPSLKSFLTTIQKHEAAEDYLNHRSLISEIISRLEKGLQQAKDAPVIAVTIEPEFKQKVQDLLANAKVRIRTEFMAGINSETRSKKQA